MTSPFPSFVYQKLSPVESARKAGFNVAFKVTHRKSGESFYHCDPWEYETEATKDMYSLEEVTLEEWAENKGY